MDVNKKILDPLSNGQLIKTLLSKLRCQFINFLQNTSFYKMVQQKLALHSLTDLAFKAAFFIGISAIVIYKYRQYFQK